MVIIMITVGVAVVVGVWLGSHKYNIYSKIKVVISR